MKPADYLKLGSPFSLAFNTSLVSQCGNLPPSNLTNLTDAELVLLSIAIRGEALLRGLPFEDAQTIVCGYLRVSNELDRNQIEELVEFTKD